MKGIIAITGAVVYLAIALAAPTPAQAQVNCTEHPCHPECNGFCGAPCDSGCYIDKANDPTGKTVVSSKPIRWAGAPIKYKINFAGVVAQGLAKEDVQAAIAAAMQTYQDVPCAEISFEYAGETTETDAVDGHLLIAFNTYAPTHENYESLYTVFHSSNWKTDDTTPTGWMEMSKARISLNATQGHPTLSFDWTTKGAEERKIDVQTFVTYALPLVLGFPVGGQGKVPVAYNHVKHDLCPVHQGLAAFVYPDGSDANCAPSEQQACSFTGGSSGTPGGTGTGTDGGTGTGTDGGTGTGTGTGTDSGTGTGTGTGSGSSSGCRVGQAHASGVPCVTLLVLGILGLVRRRRRS